jgi:hypothetical protein
MEYNGPGKYDEIATKAREDAMAEGVVLMVFNGLRGSGFSVQASDPLIVLQLPEILERVAADIRKLRASPGD